MQDGIVSSCGVILGAKVSFNESWLSFNTECNAHLFWPDYIAEIKVC